MKEIEISSRRRRILAFIIDQMLMSCLAGMGCLFALGKHWDTADIGRMTWTLIPTITIAFVLYFLKDSVRGMSPGRYVLGIAVRNHATPDGYPSISRLALRNLPMVIWPIEFLMLAFSRQKQRLGDQFTKTIVIRRKDVPGWKRALSFLGLILVSGVLLFTSSGVIIKNSSAYEYAIAQIETSSDVKEMVGDITGYGAFPSGSIQIQNQYGCARIKIKVKGATRSIPVVATMQKEPDTEWQLQSLAIQLIGGQVMELNILASHVPPSSPDDTDPFAFNPIEKETGRLFVPRQYNAIQEAVDAAEEGNVIVLSPGVYEETVIISGKSIKLVSEDPSNEKVVASTVIDGKGEGPVIVLEDSSSIVWGISVRGGFSAETGGGIYIHGKSSPLIKGNIIESCSTENFGAGIFIIQAEAPRIVGNIVRNNQASGAGGIESLESTIYMKGNKISGNQVSGPGGGIWIQECKGVFRENTVSDNSARAGAGLYISKESTIDLLGNEWSGNTAEVGAGVMVYERCTVRIDGNSFLANYAQKMGGAFALVLESTCALVNNRFERNEAPIGGVGLVEMATIEEKANNTYENNKPDNRILRNIPPEDS